MKKIVMSVRLTSEMHQALHAVADRIGMDMADIIREAVGKHLDDLSKHLGAVQPAPDREMKNA